MPGERRDASLILLGDTVIEPLARAGAAVGVCPWTSVCAWAMPHAIAAVQAANEYAVLPMLIFFMLPTRMFAPVFAASPCLNKSDAYWSAIVSEYTGIRPWRK